MSTQVFGLEDRMKRYEYVSRSYLTRRVPVVIRIDGKAFHSLTAVAFGKHYNERFVFDMARMAVEVQKAIQGCSLAYGQSDEVSFLLTDYRTIKTDAWFDYNIAKMCSVAASHASSLLSIWWNRIVMFDARAFNVPQDEVCNYFHYRQRDATRNAISMLGQEYFSHKFLINKSAKEVQAMLFEKHGINFNDLPVIRKRGYASVHGLLDTQIPEFSNDRDYIDRHVLIRED